MQPIYVKIAYYNGNNVKLLRKKSGLIALVIYFLMLLHSFRPTSSTIKQRLLYETKMHSRVFSV